MNRMVPLLCLLAACGRNSDKPPHHEDGVAQAYSMTITPAATPVAGQPIQLALELKDPQGKRVTDLQVMHEKLVHLIVVSSDLSFFTHEHPTQRADGMLDHALTLPQPGDYTAYADFTPKGGAGTVASATLSIAGTAPAPVALAPVALPASTSDGPFTVDLRTDAPLSTSGGVLLDFSIRDASGPITDLRPYLGAKGHCVIISADRKHYLHSHPMDGGDAATVRFHTLFPEAGTYKIWVEFRPRGEPLRVSFVVDVPVGTQPAGMTMTEHDH
jgi:hypothetical protein